MTTYKEAAISATERLVDCYRRNPFEGNFWFGGNALSAYLHALVATGSRDTGLLEFAVEEVYTPALANEGWWHDDYGWWGAAFVTALKERVALGLGGREHDALFTTLSNAASFCWTRLEDYWFDTTYGGDPTHPDHGVGSAPVRGGSYNDLDPTQIMSGRNTVTNAGFWALSIGLATVTGDASARSRADALRDWFSTWLDERRRDGGGLWSEQGLILERPTGHALDPGWHWTGDQGVVVADLLRQAQLDGVDPARTVAPKIVDAVTAGMTQGPSRHLQEYLGFLDVGRLNGFEVDYATGKGIYMRHLAEACRILGPAWTAAQGAFVRANASAVWRGRDVSRGGQLPFDWGTTPPTRIDQKTQELRDLVLQASGLDALSLAATYWAAEDAEDVAVLDG